MSVSALASSAAPRDARALAATFRAALLRRYVLLVAPAVVAAGLGAALRTAGLFAPGPLAPPAVAGPATFILAAILALAAPLLLRARFVDRVAGDRDVSPEAFLAFELRLLAVSLPATWAAAAASLLGVNLFHQAGALLAALYAAYFYFPSPARVAHEMRLFRVSRSGGAAVEPDAAGREERA